MSICFGRVTPMDGVSNTWPYPSFYPILNSTMPFEDASNCQAGYEQEKMKYEIVSRSGLW